MNPARGIRPLWSSGERGEEGEETVEPHVPQRGEITTSFCRAEGDDVVVVALEENFRVERTWSARRRVSPDGPVSLGDRQRTIRLEDWARRDISAGFELLMLLMLLLLSEGGPSKGLWVVEQRSRDLVERWWRRTEGIRWEEEQGMKAELLMNV
tara:strand:+ start:84 stop:545 length:462 start_codon:yes stop_codon:yes gene_type:complete